MASPISVVLRMFHNLNKSKINMLEARIGPSFKKVKAHIYQKDKNGFYVYAKPNLCDTDTVIKYISRYLGRPVIALKRIDSYDGENVTFHYNRHEDNVYVQKTLPALEFIKLLIQHKHCFFRSFTKWRNNILPGQKHD